MEVLLYVHSVANPTLAEPNSLVEVYEVIWNLESFYQLWRHMQDLNSLDQPCNYHMTDKFSNNFNHLKGQ